MKTKNISIIFSYMEPKISTQNQLFLTKPLSRQPPSGKIQEGGFRCQGFVNKAIPHILLGQSISELSDTMFEELTLTPKTFELCLKTLVNLPFTMTDDEIEPNMITVRSKFPQEPKILYKDEAMIFQEETDYEFQIWRDTDMPNSYESTLEGCKVDPNNLKFKEYQKYFDNNYTIELSFGPDPVHPNDYVKYSAL